MIAIAEVFATTGGGGIGGITPPASKLAPHVEQNGVPAAASVPHFEHSSNVDRDSETTMRQPASFPEDRGIPSTISEFRK